MTMNRAAVAATAGTSTPKTTTVTTTKTKKTTTRSRCRCRLASELALLQAPVPVLELRQCELAACEEIGVEQTPILGRREAAVRREVREIEHRGAESAVFPIDEPESIAIVDEVAG